MSIQKKYKIIGIMSGTSMDGLDFSFIETDGEKNISMMLKHETLLQLELLII